MSSFLTRDLKAERYKCSTAEFPKEYVVVYTSLEQDSALPSVFCVSESRDRVLCRVADYLCERSPVRFHTLFTTEKDGDGNRQFGAVTVVSDGTAEVTPEKERCDYNFGGFEYAPRPINGEYIVMRTSEYTWKVNHSYYVSARTKLYCGVIIQCDKVKGLSVQFGGPFKIKQHFISGDEKIGSPNERKVKGEPPKHVKARTETEFQGKAYIVFPQGTGNPTTFSGSARVEGLVNDIGVIFIADNKGRVIFNYYNHYFIVENYRGLTLRQIEQIVREMIDKRMKQYNKKREIDDNLFECIKSEIQGRSQTTVVSITNKGNYYGPGSSKNGSYNGRH